jgi:hypothetical protein
VWRSAAGLLGRIDERLNNVSFSTKAGLTTLTIFLIVVGAVLHFPAGRAPGTDTIADNYEARVVRNDVRDMYTKRLVEQTPLEAATWSKEASSPYPPATLLGLAGLAAVGDAMGVGLAGMVAAVAVVFLALSLVYFLRTRWYLFPLLYLNFGYLAERFFFVQDGSYLVMLMVVMIALLVVAGRPAAGALLMAVATTMKLSPLYYARYLGTSWMPRWVAPAWVAIVAAGLLLPYFVWENYLYIFQYNNELKGDLASAAGGAAIALACAAGLWVLDRRGAFDREEQIGWALVPVALFLAFKMNTARHLLLPLLVPDKRGTRNVAAAIGLTLDTIGGAAISLNDTLPVMTLTLGVGLILVGFRGAGVPAFQGAGSGSEVPGSVRRT